MRRARLQLRPFLSDAQHFCELLSAFLVVKLKIYYLIKHIQYFKMVKKFHCKHLGNLVNERNKGEDQINF